MSLMRLVPATSLAQSELFSFFGIASLLIALLMGALQIIEMYTFGVVLMGTALILFVTTVMVYYTAPDPASYRRKSRTLAREARGIFITFSKVMASLSGASMLGAIAAIWITGQGGKDLALAKLDAPPTTPPTPKNQISNPAEPACALTSATRLMEIPKSCPTPRPRHQGFG